MASIKNFLNEEEYNQFEGKERQKIKKLTSSEEREIHKKSTKIIEKLLTASILDSFK